jgi:hypothetical protein
MLNHGGHGESILQVMIREFGRWEKIRTNPIFLANFTGPTTMGLGTITGMKYNKFVQIPNTEISAKSKPVCENTPEFQIGIWGEKLFSEKPEAKNLVFAFSLLVIPKATIRTVGHTSVNWSFFY